jgi:hypothetical protein
MKVTRRRRNCAASARICAVNWAVREVMRRKGQVTRAQIREWWPHQVVLSADKVRGLRNSITVHEFANTLSVAPRTYWLRRNDADYVVFCFGNAEDADAFCQRFEGELLPLTPR